MRVRGIVFDFNGVLWWDTHLQDRSWREFSAGVRGAPFSADEMAIHVYGRTNRYTLEYLTGRPLATEEVDDLVQRKETVYRQMCLDQGAGFCLSPGAVGLLDWLAARGVPRTIATASERTNVEFFVGHLDLGRWFDVEKIVYDDGTLLGKPAPDLYLKAMANIGLEPRRCVVIEDSHSGLQAARAAGAGYLIALGPAGRHGALIEYPGVNLAVESLEQVPREMLFE